MIINNQTTHFTCSEFDFSNVKNTTYNCNGKQLQGNFNVANASLVFEDCEIFLGVGLVLNEDYNTKLELKNTDFAGNDFSLNNGNYTISQNITFNIIDQFTTPELVDDFNVDLYSAIPSYNITGITQNSYLVKLFEYINGTYVDYNDYVINVSSASFNSQNSTSQNLTDSNVVELSLKDNVPPSMIRSQLDKINTDNTTLVVNFIFDERVNGTFTLFNSTNDQINQINVTDYKDNHSITFSGLIPDTLYKINAYSYDRFNNLPYDSPYQIYKTYITLNATTSINDTYTYSGNPQNTTSFEFSGNDVKINYLETVNLSNNYNLSNEIFLRNNFIFINSSSRFNKMIEIIFSDLVYESTPFILVDGNLCTNLTGCSIEDYDSSLKILKFNVTSPYQNITSISNSVLDINWNHMYAGLPINLSVNFSRYNDSIPINGTCQISIDSQTLPLMYNNVSLFYERNFSYDKVGNHSYTIRCSATDYDDKFESNVLELKPQIIDNFTTNIIFNNLGGKLTKLKSFNVSIISDGTNNTQDYFDTEYSFLISKDNAYPFIGWNTSLNLTSWVNIGKQEFVEIFNNGQSYTNYRLSNGTLSNFSQFIFIDERNIEGDGTSIYATVRACISSGECKYYANSNNYLIYEDTSGPDLVGEIQIPEYYNKDDELNFSFIFRDYESRVESVKFSVFKDGSSPSSPTKSISFSENENSTYVGAENFDEGGVYKIALEAENKIGLKSSVYQSDSFTIDTIAPVNASLFVNVSENNYYNSLILNLTFDAGNDFNFNYSNLGIQASGLDYQKLFIQNATLEDNQCNIFGDLVEINETFTKVNTSYQINLSDSYCYNIYYRVYDKAGNYNQIIFNETIKVDLTKPSIENLPEGVTIIDYTPSSYDGVNNINKYYHELIEDSTLFKVRYNITDLESSIQYYNIDIINNNTGLVVASFTNYTSSIFDVKFNSSYINDNTNYKVRVSGVNYAGLESNKIITNGATIFIQKIPYLKLYENYFIGQSVFDYVDDNLTELNFYDLNGFNNTCKIYETDLGYQNDSGTLCVSDYNNVTCLFNSTLGLNNFYISCKSLESIKEGDTYNNQTTNYDLQIYVEENFVPKVNSTQINISENEMFDVNFDFLDNNTLNYLIGYFTFNIDNLTVRYDGSDAVRDEVALNLIDENRNDSILNITDNLYTYRFNNSIKYSQVRDLCSDNVDCKLTFSSSNWNQELTFGTYDFSNSNNTYLNGISNNIKFINLTNNRGYNLTFNQNGNVLWDLENSSIRQDSFDLTFWIRDDLNLSKQNVTINVLPIYYVPKLNNSFYNDSDEFNLTEYELKTIDASKYFYEENSHVGLNGTLKYFYSNKNNLNVYEFNQSSGKLVVYSSNVGVSSISIGALNVQNDSISSKLDFNIVESNDNVTPQINVVSPSNGFTLNSAQKLLNFDVRSNENLAKVFVELENISYNLCEGFCSNISKNFPILNLKSGANDLKISIEDFGGNINYSNVLVNYNFDDSAQVVDTIYSNLNASFYVEGDDNLSQDFNGIKQVEFKDGRNISFIDFIYNFSQNLTFENTSIVLDNSSESVSLIVNGLYLNGSKKNVLIPESTNGNFNSICIKDEEVFSIAQMSSNCQGSNEYYLSCDGSESSGYSCSPVIQNGSSFYKISGLSHSAVKLVCTENWQVGSWSACSGSTQTRSVVDLNNCGTSFNKPVSSQSCTVPSSGGGSSSGGGGSSSSSSSSGSSYIPIPPKEEPKENESIVENKTEVIVPVEPVENNPIYLGNLNNEIKQELELGQKYSFSLNGQSFDGELVKGFDGLIFKTDSQDIGFEKLSIDTNQDGQDDLELYLAQDANNVYLTSSKIEIKGESEFEESLTPQEESNYVFIGLIIVLMIGGISGLGYVGYNYYLKGKHNKDNSSVEKVKANVVNKTIQENKAVKKVEAAAANVYGDFDSLADKLILYSDNLKEIVLQEKDLLEIIKDSTREMVSKGFSWTDIYFYLKSKHLSNFYINKIIDFEYLIQDIEQFILSNDVSDMSSEVLQKKLLKESWASELYIYDSDGQDILRDVLFMIAGTNIYGFRKEKFRELFKDELEKGKKEFISIDFVSKFKELNQSTEEFDLLSNIQEDLEKLRKELFEFKNQVKRINLVDKEKQDLFEIIDELDIDIRRHLE